MKRALLTMVVLLTLGIGAGVLASPYPAETRKQGDGSTEGATEERVTTEDGRLTVNLPPGWVKNACPAGAPVTCLRISPAQAGVSDHIMLSVFRPEGWAGTYGSYTEHMPAGSPDHPSYSRLTINGMDAIRIDSEQLSQNKAAGSPAGWLLMAGRVSADDTEEFLMSCEYRSRRAEVRASCDSVAGSLHVHR
ncbi:hypothetical protein ACGFJ5_12045 [Micromonospora echinaurantiaca]|uniref:hypothetical protein n=1 Tax=Micromonospora echinaurantiaca TaxID=47857 RepID=UPI003719D3E3